MKYISKSFIRWASVTGLSAITLAAVTQLSAQTVHIAHCMAGCPVNDGGILPDDSELIVRQLFVASINSRTGLSDWQAYRVLADSVGVASLLPRAWYEDSLVSPNVASANVIDDGQQFVQALPIDAEERSYQLNEINILSEDQGRLVPMSSFAGTPYWSELNFLSNMAALPFELRAGSWSRLDQAINALANKTGEVFVVTGPIYDDRERVDDDALINPSAYFKVISTRYAMSAFIFSSDVQQHVNFCDQLSTMEVVEGRSGLDLFPQRGNDFTDTLHAQLGCAP